MMQVEEKPDVTYSDIGGCKEQIEKLREVVETPLLNVRILVFLQILRVLTVVSPSALFLSALTLLRVSFSMGRLVPAKLSAHAQLQTGLMQHSYA